MILGNLRLKFFSSVELLVLRRLKDRFAFDCGEHSEQSLFSTLLSLCLFEIIVKLKPDGVWQTIYQTGPLDFFSRQFYLSRKSEIDTRLNLLSGDEFENILSEMEKIWEKITDRHQLIGISYTPENMTWENLSSVCRCIGGKNLAKIFRRIVKNPQHRSGIPDLIGELIIYRTKNFYYVLICKTPKIILKQYQNNFFKLGIQMALLTPIVFLR